MSLRVHSGQAHRTSVHDLKSLVLSFHSLIVIETVEEERVRSLLHEVAVDLRLPMFEWSLTIRFNLELPDPEELRDLVRTVIDALGARQKVSVELSRDDAQHLVQALSGLTLNQARQVIAQAVVDDGMLNAGDIQSVIRAKG